MSDERSNDGGTKLYVPERNLNLSEVLANGASFNASGPENIVLKLYEEWKASTTPAVEAYRAAMASISARNA